MGFFAPSGLRMTGGGEARTAGLRMTEGGAADGTTASAPEGVLAKTSPQRDRDQRSGG